MNVTCFLCAVSCKVFLPLKCLFCHSKRTNINAFYGNIIEDQHKLVNKFEMDEKLQFPPFLLNSKYGEMHMYQDPFHPIGLK